MRIYDLLQNLISKKFYIEEAIQNKLNVFYAMNVLNDEEYSNLMLKVQEVYVVIEEVQEEHKASKGIANLLILLVILVGVTLASIELGKFLYNVYGK